MKPFPGKGPDGDPCARRSDLADLAILNQYLERFTSMSKRLSHLPGQGRAWIAHVDALKSLVAILFVGRGDFETIDQLSSDRFFAESLGLKEIPSESALRRHLEEYAEPLGAVADICITEFFKRASIPLDNLPDGHVTLDIGVLPMADPCSFLGRARWGHVCKNLRDLIPVVACLSMRKWALTTGLLGRSNDEFAAFLARVIDKAQWLTDAPLLIRMDDVCGAWDACKALSKCNQADYILKWNCHDQNLPLWYRRAFTEGRVNTSCPGKEVALLSVEDQHSRDNEDGTQHKAGARLVIMVTKYTTDKSGATLLVPEVKLEGWWTSLRLSEEAVIALYQDHLAQGRHISRFKNETGLDRFISSMPSVNQVILASAALACNIRHLIYQPGFMIEEPSPSAESNAP
ncbi:MAG: hypothetical protein ACP5SG_09565 [Dissulfurimicrobium sp.]|uniref:hypothetical protein n=1 Tax=Dissulfurimicrobium sp. TaxID=2022436 RepID=UPI003D112DDD